MRKQSRSDRRRWLSPEALAGWVLADIFVVLFLVGLGSSPPEAVPETPVPPTSTPSPTAPPAQDRKIVGMRTRPSVRFVEFDPLLIAGPGPGHKSEREGVCRRLGVAVQGLQDRRAALVLIFAGGPDVLPAQSHATAVGNQLVCSGAPFNRKTVSRAFWDGGLPSSSARLEIFSYVTK